MSPADLILSSQWSGLRVWLATLDTAEQAAPSALDGWTVGDLLAHLARVADSVAALQPAAGDLQPISVADYLHGYRSSAADIGQTTRDIAAANGGRLLALIDEARSRADRKLALLGGLDRVVLARRGPILLSDFLNTRIIELVVHAGDLHRSLPHHVAPPVLPSARRRVHEVLLDVLRVRSAHPDQALVAAGELDADEFVLLAAGRSKAGEQVPAVLRHSLPLF